MMTESDARADLAYRTTATPPMSTIVLAAPTFGADLRATIFGVIGGAAAVIIRGRQDRLQNYRESMIGAADDYIQSIRPALDALDSFQITEMGLDPELPFIEAVTEKVIASRLASVPNRARIDLLFGPNSDAGYCVKEMDFHLSYFPHHLASAQRDGVDLDTVYGYITESTSEAEDAYAGFTKAASRAIQSGYQGPLRIRLTGWRRHLWFQLRHPRDARFNRQMSRKHKRPMKERGEAQEVEF